MNNKPATNKIQRFKKRKKRSENNPLRNVSPLLVVTNLGYLNCVKYLIERCGANVKQTATVTIDGVNTLGASPLWCAAAKGHLDIVSYLIEKGNADINVTTEKTKSTPTMAACSSGHLNVVKYLVGERNADVENVDAYGNTCLMIACRGGYAKIVDYLVKFAAANVNRKNPVDGNTALHKCNDSVKIIQTLLNHGAKLDATNKRGITPVITASIKGNSSIIYYLIENNLISEKVDSLELLGATLIDEKNDYSKAIEIWNWASANDYSLDEIYYKALSIRNRILGPAHPDTGYYIRQRGIEYGSNGDINRCVDWWIYILDMEQSAFQTLNVNFQYSFMLTIELLCIVLIEMKQKYNSINYKYFCDVRNVFEKCVKQIEKDANFLSINKENIKKKVEGQYFHRMLIVAMYLTSLLAKVEPLFFGNEGCCDFRKTLRYLVKEINPKGINEISLRRLAFSKTCVLPSDYSFSLATIKFPDQKVVDLLEIV